MRHIIALTSVTEPHVLGFFLNFLIKYFRWMFHDFQSPSYSQEMCLSFSLVIQSVFTWEIDEWLKKLSSPHQTILFGLYILLHCVVMKIKYKNLGIFEINCENVMGSLFRDSSWNNNKTICNIFLYFSRYSRQNTEFL